MKDVPKYPQARLYPSEVVTLGVDFALKGGRFSHFYQWIHGTMAPVSRLGGSYQQKNV